MIFPLFRRSARPDTISTLYGTIVAQARMPCFYRDFAVADTVNGRFDLLVLHMDLVLHRLTEDPALKELGQALFDRFCQDMDHNLREMGVGDLSVPKEMRRIGEAFYGRAQAYRTALLAEDNGALEKALVRNIYGGTVPAAGVPGRLAVYMREATLGLRRQSAAMLKAGKLCFPDPTAIVFVEDEVQATKD